jgi:hypothetical protein
MSDSITMRAYDEVEGAEFRPQMRAPYGSRVAGLLNDYTRQYGKPAHFSALITEHAGTDLQREALDAHYEAVSEDVIEDGSAQDLDELALILLMLACSNHQRKRHAIAWSYMPWGLPTR